MIYFSTEQLHHFNCKCGEWFSVGDFNIRKRKKLFCPFCGEKQKIKFIGKKNG